MIVHFASWDGDTFAHSSRIVYFQSDGVGRRPDPLRIHLDEVRTNRPRLETLAGLASPSAPGGVAACRWNRDQLRYPSLAGVARKFLIEKSTTRTNDSYP
jgi:hypothetical protein